MGTVTIIDRSGAEHNFKAADGRSIMEIIRENGIDELLALCGGSCSCATCHVYVEGGPVAALNPPGADEKDLLGTSDHQTDASRLSCQIRYSAALDGLRVRIAPED